MNRHLQRLSSTTVALLLLLASIAYIVVPTAAQAEPAPPGPYRIGTGFTPPVNQPPVEYDVPSAGFWPNELTWNKDTEEITWGTLTYDWDEIEEIALLEPPEKYLVGTIEHVLTRWHSWRTKPKNAAKWAKMSANARAKKWGSWLNTYSSNTSQAFQGAGGELLIGEVQGLPEKGFEHDMRVSEDIDERPDWGLRTGPESYSHLIEVKSGKWHIDEIRTRFELAVQTGATKLDAYFLKDLNQKQITELEDLAAEFPGIEARFFAYPAVPRKVVNPNAYKDPPDGAGSGVAPPSGPGPIVPPGSIVAGGQNGAESPSTDAFSNSPDSAEEAAEVQEMTEQLAEDNGYANPEDAEMTSDRLGGVDFSSLELRYVSDTYDGGVGAGVDYAYSVDANDEIDVAYGGRESAQLAADSFFTWLALPTDTFWVNLNPDEPDRIIDPDFGSTDAGRVLLQADLDMKKSVADFIHPDTKTGAEYWDRLRGESKCISMRQWIVPKPAVVKDSGDALHILDAPLEVKMEGEYFTSKGVGGDAGCTGQSSSDTDFNEDVYADMILPKVEDAVNTAPEFADLRRVYASRVAAEWYRHRSQTKTTAYSDIIDSGDVSAWPARKDWDPKDVFDEYVKSYEEGEFNVERQTRKGDYIVTTTYVYGGVTFFDVPSRSLSDAEFDAQHPALAAAVGESMAAPTVEDGAAMMWLGGRSTERPLWDPLPLPPTPLGNPFFWALSTLPVAAWVAVGVFLWRRRRTRSGALSAGVGVIGQVAR